MVTLIKVSLLLRQFFDTHAIEKAKNAHHKIILIDGNKLVDLMYEFNVGMQIKNLYEVKQTAS